jgi:hypothetical protein
MNDGYSAQYDASPSWGGLGDHGSEYSNGFEGVFEQSFNADTGLQGDEHPPVLWVPRAEDFMLEGKIVDVTDEPIPTDSIAERSAASEIDAQELDDQFEAERARITPDMSDFLDATSSLAHDEGTWLSWVGSDQTAPPLAEIFDTSHQRPGGISFVKDSSQTMAEGQLKGVSRTWTLVDEGIRASTVLGAYAKDAQPWPVSQ